MNFVVSSMTRAKPMSKPKLHRWRISRIRGTPAEFIGPRLGGRDK
jgi:hypothetical protein